MTSEQRRKRSGTVIGTWLIKTWQVRGRWVWEIPYPISRFSITGTKSFATKSWACRDALRVTQLLKAKYNG